MEGDFSGAVDKLAPIMPELQDKIQVIFGKIERRSKKKNKKGKHGKKKGLIYFCTKKFLLNGEGVIISFENIPISPLTSLHIFNDHKISKL